MLEILLPMSDKQNDHKGEEGKVTFARTLGLFDATMIGIGAMIGAGIFVLTGIACGEAGPGSLLAFGLNGAVTLITAMAYAELASSIPEAGGGYAYVKNAFPDGWPTKSCASLAPKLSRDALKILDNMIVRCVSRLIRADCACANHA